MSTKPFSRKGKKHAMDHPWRKFVTTKKRKPQREAHPEPKLTGRAALLRERAIELFMAKKNEEVK